MPVCTQSVCLLRRDGRPAARGFAVRHGITSSTITDSTGRSFRERFERGAFRDILARNGGAVPLLVDHDEGRRVGIASVWDSGLGLEFEALLDTSPDGLVVQQAIARGTVRGTSFAFRPAASGTRWSDGGKTRVVTQVGELIEISVLLTAQPAYSTSAPDDVRTWQWRLEVRRMQLQLAEVES